MFEIKSHAMRARVDTFPALQCHGRGIRQRMAARKAPMGSSGCIMVESVSEKDVLRDSQRPLAMISLMRLAYI